MVAVKVVGPMELISHATPKTPRNRLLLLYAPSFLLCRDVLRCAMLFHVQTPPFVRMNNEQRIWNSVDQSTFTMTEYRQSLTKIILGVIHPRGVLDILGSK